VKFEQGTMHMQLGNSIRELYNGITHLGASAPEASQELTNDEVEDFEFLEDKTTSLPHFKQPSA
jgi:hypothetical protein